MKGTKLLREMKQMWKKNNREALTARGASRGICTIWNTTILKENTD
jgi:hypothetical protein